MKLQRNLSIAYNILNSRLLNKKIPILIQWEITNKCNLKCKYCEFIFDQEELGTKEIFQITDDLIEHGCKRIKFTGGEPFLRRDLNEIVKYCHKKGIFTSIITNGLLLLENNEIIDNLDQITVSLDGPKEIQDEHRGEGTYDRIMELFHALPRHKLSINCVIHKQNFKNLGALLDIAKKFNIGVHFLPVYVVSDDKIGPYRLSPENYKEAYSYLIEKKKDYPILDSLAGLKFWLDYPDFKKFKCVSGKIFFRISADGKLYHCQAQRYINKEKGIPLIGTTFRDAAENLESFNCLHPYTSGMLELSGLYHFNIGVFTNFCKTRLFR